MPISTVFKNTKIRLTVVLNYILVGCPWLRRSSSTKFQADVKTGADKCAVRTTSRARLSHFSFYFSPFPVPRFSNIPPYGSATRGDVEHSDHSR